MTEQIISVRISGSLLEVFNRAMENSGSNASEFLRDAIRKRVEGMVPGPLWIDPVEEARSVLNDKNYLANQQTRPVPNSDGNYDIMSNEDWLRNVCKRMAFTVLRQDELLRKFESLAEKSTNERRNIIREFSESRLTPNPRAPLSPVHYPPPLPYDFPGSD